MSLLATGNRERSDRCYIAVRCLVLLAALSTCGNICALGQGGCQYGSDDAAASLVKALREAQSCSAAAKKLHDCEWGSSADTQFAPIVVEKCEKTFLNKLSPTAEKRYDTEMQLCAYEYARQEGTLSMSEAAMCQVDTAVEFAANPAIANQPEPGASFNCEQAGTALEKAICSDIALGHADIVLSRVYSGLLKNSNKEVRPRLIENEKTWLRDVPGKCGLASFPTSEQTLNCIRNEFEIRFSWLDSCADEDASKCLQSPVEGEESPSKPSGSTARASFDCETPSSALEIVICADAELGHADIKLAEAYRNAGHTMSTSQYSDLVTSERNWLHYVTTTCPLGVVGGIPPVWTRGCVRRAFEARIQQLEACPQKISTERIPCLNDFRLEPNEVDHASDQSITSSRVN